MVIVSFLLLKGLKKLDLKGLFTEKKGDQHISSSKFWANIAYFVSTIAFLAINLAAPQTAALEFIWAIYLGVVASAAVVSKFLALRYGPAGVLANQDRQDEEPYYEYERPRRGRRRTRTDEVRNEETTSEAVRDLPEGYSDR